jgi:hypothetical protein
MCSILGGSSPGYIAESDPIHSRFHPVPTRPALWPRSSPSPPPIPGGPFPEAPISASSEQVTSASKGARPLPLEIRAPEPPEQEIPTAPLPSGDRQTQTPRRLAAPPDSQSWVFPKSSAGSGAEAQPGRIADRAEVVR